MPADQIAIPDFSIMPNRAEGMDDLRRYDLATLRQLASAGTSGIEDGDLIGKDSRRRLIVHGMAERRLGPDGYARNCVTDYGCAVVRANASCIDGSEGYAR